MEDICMRSNNSQKDIVNFIRNLRENEKLFDVTLVSGDGQQIQSHKIILAAGSIFFNDIFMKSNHNNMLIYLKGISSAQLEPIIDFMYRGEAFITQDELKQFLETGKECR